MARVSVQVMASKAAVVLTRPATSTVLRAGVHPDGTIHYIEIEATESDGDRVEVSFQTHDVATLRSVVAAMQRGLAKIEGTIEAFEAKAMSELAASGAGIR